MECYDSERRQKSDSVQDVLNAQLWEILTQAGSHSFMFKTVQQSAL